MLDDKGFDLWADGYDKAVRLSDESNEYPFAAYKEVLNTVYKIASSVSLMKILFAGENGKHKPGGTKKDKERKTHGK